MALYGFGAPEGQGGRETVVELVAVHLSFVLLDFVK